MSSTNLTDFRNQYLAKVSARLMSADVATATDTDLILQSALLKAYDAVNQFDTLGPGAVSTLAVMTGIELQTWLEDVANRQAFEAIIASTSTMTAVAASPAAMTVVAASSTAISAVLANSSAWAAIVLSPVAISAVAASTTAMAALLANSAAWAAVLASQTAMATLLNATVARGAVWASASAMNAIQNAPSNLLDALQSHPRVSLMSGSLSSLQTTFISSKSMILRLRTTSPDSVGLRTLAGGSGSGDDMFATTATWTTRVRAYSNLCMYSSSYNYQFQAYVMNMN